MPSALAEPSSKFLRPRVRRLPSLHPLQHLRHRLHKPQPDQLLIQHLQVFPRTRPLADSQCWEPRTHHFQCPVCLGSQCQDNKCLGRIPRLRLRKRPCNKCRLQKTWRTLIPNTKSNASSAGSSIRCGPIFLGKRLPVNAGTSPWTCSSSAWTLLDSPR